MLDRLLIALIAVAACAFSFHLGASTATTPAAAPEDGRPERVAALELRLSEVSALPQQSEARKLDEWRSLVNFAPPRIDRSGRRRFIDLIHIEAEKSALPAEIADAVAYVESSYDPTRIGDVGEIGLMQVRPTTAYMLGFRGSDSELADPINNIHYGVLYLAQAWRLADGDLCRALMKYRAGHGAELMSLRSAQYCSRAKAYLDSMRAPLALNVGNVGAAPPKARALPASRAATDAIPSVKMALRARRLGGSEAYWAVHEARIRALTARVQAKWQQRAGQQRRRVT